MADLVLPPRALEKLAQGIRNRCGQSAPWIMSRNEGEEFARMLARYQRNERSMKGLALRDFDPVEETLLVNDIGFQERSGSRLVEDEPDGVMGFSGVSEVPTMGSIDCEQKQKRTKIPCIRHDTIPKCPDSSNLTSALLNKVAIVRLNGGMGTSMGCKGPKSAIEVRNGQSFLDLAVHQVEFLNTQYGVDVPLVLMNSLNTDMETKRVLSRYDGRHVKIITFLQSCYPRTNKSTLTLIPSAPYSSKDSELWYPPGHGDVYASMARCGLLKELISQGKEYVFISNIDNLGSTVDLNLLYHTMENDFDFVMEVTKKTKQDTEGGVLVARDNKTELLEVNTLPRAQGEALARDPKFDKFNTNNLWVNIRALQSLIATNKGLELPVVARQRMQLVDGEEMTSLLFETAAGSAVSLFDKVCAIMVPRDRFFRVKTTDDLFAMQSSHFKLKHGSLRFNTSESSSKESERKLPTVKLGPKFRNVEDYKKRLPFGVPDISELEHLTVSGDVRFRNNVVLKGTVILVADEGKHIDICSGSILRDKVMTGHLNILPH